MQDPLLSWFSRIRIKNNIQQNDRSMILKIADTIMETRLNTGPRRLFSPKGDPVLDNVLGTLESNKYCISWSKIAFLCCSAGGDVALRSLMRYIKVPHIPLVIAMHHRPGFDFMIKFDMENSTFHKPVLIENCMPISASKLYFIPGNVDLGFARSLNIFQTTPHIGRARFRPDINSILSNAAARYGSNLITVIMSGMLDDGAAGAAESAAKGAKIYIQDPSTAMFKDMPNAAMKKVQNITPLKLSEIAEAINKVSVANMIIEPI
jgi:two-component system chemotaxis response regulator CheB